MAEESSYIHIEGDGTLRATLAGRQKLGPHAGDYRLLTAAGGLLILQRQGAHGGPRFALAGIIDESGLMDLLHFISSGGWSGQLHIVDGPVRKTLYLRKGDLTTAASNVATDRLGVTLYRYGLIHEDQLLEAAKRATGGASKIGQILVEMGALSAHDLFTYVRKQVEDIFFSVLSFKQGEFYFLRAGEDEGPPSQLKISTQALLFEGVTRVDELAYFREKLPSLDVIPERREPRPAAEPAPRERAMLELIDGERDLGELARVSHLGEFEATKIVFALLQSRHVKLRPPMSAVERGGQLSEIDREARQQLIERFNQAFVKIHVTAAQKGLSASLDRGLKSYFGSLGEFAPLFGKLGPGADGSLPVGGLLGNLEHMSVPHPLDYLHRGLHDLLLFELFTTGEGTGRREDSALNRDLTAILGAAPVR